MNRRLAAFAASLAVLTFAATIRPARAGSAGSTLTVSANVLGACTIDPATLTFVDYDPAGVHLAAPLDEVGTITVHCTQGTTYSIGLDLGLHEAGTQRRMQGVTTGEFLEYELYRAAARGATDVWGDAPGSLVSGSATTVAAGLSDYTHTVYGRITAGQNVGVGDYSDSVAMTVNF
jgi:spore coat protein U-like protein